MSTINPEMRIIDLTVSQFQELLNQVPKESITIERDPEEHVYGLFGLSSLLGISKATACKLNRSGKIRIATTRIGQKLIFNKAKVLELLTEKNTETTKRAK